MMNHLNPTEWILDFLLINVTHSWKSYMNVKNTSIKILPIKQTLKLHTAWINLDYAVYNGKLDGKYADDKYSIVFSDINGDGVNDLIIQQEKRCLRWSVI